MRETGHGRQRGQAAIIEQLFDNLDRWRHLPAYQLERRADVFFAPYMVEVIQSHTGVEIDPRLVPELPIKRDLIWPDRPSRQSVKVDYAVFAKDRSKVFLVELKTDGASRRDDQDFYLQRAKEIGLGSILEGLIEIAQASSAHQKYGHLLSALAELGCLSLPQDLADHIWPSARRGLRARQREIAPTLGPDEFAVEVIYVQPSKTPGVSAVDFEEFARVVEARGDVLSLRFADSLRRWTAVAGAAPPRG